MGTQTADISATYRVVAPLVMLKVATSEGVSVRHFYTGSIVGGLVDEAQVQRHLDQDPPMIELFTPPAGVQPAGDPDTPDQAQTGSTDPGDTPADGTGGDGSGDTGSGPAGAKTRSSRSAGSGK
jgi:hypothetical protein